MMTDGEALLLTAALMILTGVAVTYMGAMLATRFERLGESMILLGVLCVLSSVIALVIA